MVFPSSKPQRRRSAQLHAGIPNKPCKSLEHCERTTSHTEQKPPIITTGNELAKKQIADFSKHLNLNELYSYILEVKSGTETIIGSLSFDDLKQKISEETKECLKSLNVVSEAENAVRLIDYWCGKDIRGLLQMPFSRHWIMHTEACLRIKNKVHP